MKVPVLAVFMSLCARRDVGCSRYGGNGRLQPHRSPWPSAAETPMRRSAEVPGSIRHEHELGPAPAALQVDRSRV